MKKATFIFLIIVFISILAFAFFPFTSFPRIEELKIEVKTVQPFAYCCIHHKGPFTEIQNVITQLIFSFERQRIPAAYAMVGVYYNSPEDTDPQNLEWDIGFPCPSHIFSLAQPLQKKVWNFTKVATAIHSGSYENTRETYQVIFDWLEANGMEIAGPVLERYLTMPTPDTNPEDMRIEIWVPFKQR